MQFTTTIPIPKSNFSIDYNSKIIAFGSCFAENMASKFDYFKFQNWVNPFGIIFNPISIEKLLFRIVNTIPFTDKDIFFHNEAWHCFEVHSELSNISKIVFLTNLNQILIDANSYLKSVTHCIFTFGTSWTYRFKESQEIVANCHKVPQGQFKKELLSIEEIQKSIQNTTDLIQKINPNCNCILTISPVRHLKDGFIENQVSKSHLISAIYAVKKQLKSTSYFPGFEIMMDELRDYRFYAQDMLHPNVLAIGYIWEQFVSSCIAETENKTMQEIDAIQKSLQHKPFNPDSESHKKFLKKLEHKMQILQNRFSFMIFER